MKSMRNTVALIGLVVSSAMLTAQSTPSPEAQLKAAMNRETVQRDLPGAIEQYKQIASTFQGNHAVAAKALLQLGGIYERQGKAEAQGTYQRIISDYADTPTAVTARARLTKLQGADAGPFSFKNLDEWFKDTQGAWVSPNGKYLAYRKNGSQGPSAESAGRPLFIRDLVSGKERRLVDAKPGEWPYLTAWSPDSQRIAALWKVPSGLEFRFITLSTGESHTLAKAAFAGPAFQLHWSPDSRMVLFILPTSRPGQHTQFEVRLATVGAGDTVLLESAISAAPSAAWAPDSRRLAYSKPGASQDEIRIVTPGTKGTQSVTIDKPTPNSRVTVKSWTPAGEVFYSQNVNGGNDSFLVSASGGSPQKVCEGRGSSGGDGCQDLSPDGTQLILRRNISGGGRVVLKNVKDNSERTLTPEAVWEQTALGGFSPDGRLFLFRSNREGGYGLYVAAMDRIPVASPVKIAQLDSEASAVSGSWTSQGLVIRINNNQTNQYRIDLDSARKPIGPPIRLTESSPQNISARVSPDGKRIAYISRGRPTGFALMDANGANERVIKEVPPDMLLRMNLVGWLNDNLLMITDAGLGTGNLRQAAKKLFALNITAGDMRPLGPDVVGNGVWIAGGRSLVYTNAKDDFILRPIAGGDEKVIHLDNWWEYEGATGGNWISYSTADDSAANRPIPGDIRVRSLETGSEKIVAKWPDTKGGEHAPAALSADGRFLVYQDPNLKLWMTNVETGESWPLLKNPPADVDFEYASCHFAPDGSYVVIEGYISRSTWRAYNGVTYDAVTKLLNAKK
ncbi:MAG TPA: hypothetical protein VFV78_14145 [Vicinamibacterales bacterium]|nr:hypothetical protein [Vicinamibacterales bacterium]